MSWIGGLCAGLAALAAEPLLALLNTPAELLPLAVPLLRWLALSVLLDAWNTPLASVLRSQLHARPTMVVNVTMQLAHLALALLLMNGAFGWPGLGLPGFAVALLLARGLGLACLLQTWRQRLGLVPSARDWWAWRQRVLGPVLQVGLPGAAENICWRAAYVFSLSVVGTLGTQALATHAYTMQISHLILVFAATLGLAGEIMVGHLVGAGQLHRAHHRFPLVAGAASFLLVMAGGSWLLGAWLGWGLVGVWLAYAADEWLRSLIMWRRWLGLGWVPAARRMHRRLKLKAAEPP